jgi:GxxExxY protein
MDRDPDTYAVIGAAMEVHGQLGCGFLEAVYQEALEVELAARGIPFQAQAELPVEYKGRRLKAVYRADLICFDRVTVELKALGALGGAEEAQVLNYLKASRHPVGLLVNFGTKSLQYKRFVLG